MRSARSRRALTLTFVWGLVSPVGCVDRLIQEDANSFGAAGGDSQASGDSDSGGDDDVPSTGRDLPPDDDDFPPCTGEPEGDCDSDGIPNDDDPFPSDPGLPGQVSADVVYANSSDALYTVTPGDWTSQIVAEFSFDSQGAEVTDIAIDRFGVLYAVTTGALFVCTPTAQCFFLATLGGVNAAGFVPAARGTDDDDTLYVAQFDGGWVRVELHGADALPEVVGYYRGAVSSGDIAAFGGMTVASVDQGGVVTVQSIDPLTGDLLGGIGFDGFPYWGLTSWGGILIGFTSDGLIMVPPADVVEASSVSWWGAAVHPSVAG